MLSMHGAHTNAPASLHTHTHTRSRLPSSPWSLSVATFSLSAGQSPDLSCLQLAQQPALFLSMT